MSDPTTAIPLEVEQAPAQLSVSWAYEARALVTGLLYTAAVAAAGTVVVILALVVGVVTAPLLVAGVGYVVLRQGRRARLGAPAAWGAAGE